MRQLLPLGEISGWRAAEWSASGARDWQPRFENPAASTQAAFAQDGRVVGLYLAYYRNQDQQSKLVSSTNVLVTSDDPHWARVSGGMRDISFNQQALKVRTAQLRASSASVGLVVWQWYWVNGRWTSSDVLAKAYTALSQLTGKGDDSAVIIVLRRRIKQARRLPHSMILLVRRGRRWKPSCARHWKPGDKGIRQAAAGGPCGIQF